MMRDNMANAPRMSLSALNVMDDPDRQVRIYLLGATTTKGAVFYRVAGRFSSSGQTWQVNRRYSEFLVLRDTLIKYFSRTTDTCPGCLNYLHSIQQFDFPKKHLFVSKSQLVVNYRIQALRSFMNLLASWAFSNSPKCPTCGGFAFDIVRNFCLESAEAVGDSNMSSIRESFVVTTFTEAGRRSSFTRRNSFIPASNSQTLNAQQRDQPQRLSDNQHRPEEPRARRDEGAYDAFNDYLVRQPSQQAKAMQSRSAINIRQNRPNNDNEAEQEGGNGNGNASSRGLKTQPLQRGNSGTGGARAPQHSASNSTTQQPSIPNGSFLFYQDGVEREHSAAGSQRGSTTINSGSASGSQRGGPPLSGTKEKRGILKNWNDVQRDRTQNDSYFSLGGSSAASREARDAANSRPSSSRGAQKNRSDNRSENNSYFSIGASSSNSREEDDHGRRSSKPMKKSNSYPHVDNRQQQQQQLRDGRYDRSQNDSYLSLGASSASGDLEHEEHHPQYPSVQPSQNSYDARYTQPPPMQKGGGSSKMRSPPPSFAEQRKSQRARSPPPPNQRESQRTRSPPPSSQRKNQRDWSPPPQDYEEDDQPRSSRRHHQPQQQQQRSHRKPHVVADESFATDSFVDDSLRFDGMGPIAFVDDVSDSDDDDDEIDVTGLVIDPPAKPHKSTSGQDLWQPWELAKAG